MQRKVRILRRSVPLWLILFLLIASGIGAAVGTILAGRVTGEVPVTVGQALLVGEPTFPDGLPGGVNIQSIRINPNRMAQNIGILGDDWTSFQAAVEANTGDVFLIKLPLKNASNQDMIVQLDMVVPDCIEVDVFGADDESDSAVDHVFNVTQTGYSTWVFRLSDLAEHYAADWRDSIGIVVGVDDTCQPGFYNIGVTLQQIAGGASDKAVLGITKTGPSTANTNSQVSYTITVTNSSEVTATNLTVKDTIPGGMSYVSSSPTGTLSGSQVTWTLASLAPGDSTVFSLTLLASQAGTWTNRATATSAEGLSVEATVTTNVGTTGQVSLSKTGSTQVNQASNATYTIVATNNGTTTLTNTVVTDTIPTGMTYVSSSPTASVVGNTVTWSLGSLTSGQQRVMTLTLLAATTGTWTDYATFSCTQGVTANASATTVVGTTTGQASLSKTGSTQVNQAANAVYTIVATNNGTTTLTNTVVTDTIPTGMTYVSSSPTASVVGNTVTWSLGSMTSGQQSVMTLTLLAATTGTWTDYATFSCTQGVTANDSATTVVVSSGQASLTKTGPSQVNQSANAVYTIVATNTGTTTLTNAVVTDQIPTGMTYVSSSPTASVVGNTVTWSLGSMTSGQQRTLTLTLLAATTGTWTNSAAFSCTQGVTANASTTTVVTAAPSGMTMTSTDTTDPVSVGNLTTYVITATNQGSTALHNLSIVNTISPLMTFVNATGPGSYTVSGQTVTFSTVATVSAHQTLTYYVTVRAATAGAALNITTMTYDEFALPITAQEGTSIAP